MRSARRATNIEYSIRRPLLVWSNQGLIAIMFGTGNSGSLGALNLNALNKFIAPKVKPTITCKPASQPKEQQEPEVEPSTADAHAREQQAASPGLKVQATVPSCKSTMKKRRGRGARPGSESRQEGEHAADDGVQASSDAPPAKDTRKRSGVSGGTGRREGIAGRVAVPPAPQAAAPPAGRPSSDAVDRVPLPSVPHNRLHNEAQQQQEAAAQCHDHTSTRGFSSGQEVFDYMRALASDVEKLAPQVGWRAA